MDSTNLYWAILILVLLSFTLNGGLHSLRSPFSSPFLIHSTPYTSITYYILSYIHIQPIEQQTINSTLPSLLSFPFHSIYHRIHKFILYCHSNTNNTLILPIIASIVYRSQCEEKEKERNRNGRVCVVLSEQPSVESEWKKDENENSSIEVSRIHLEYRISQFLLYSHHIQ